MQSERRPLNLETTYFPETGIVHAHLIRLALERDADAHDMVGSLALDPNTCGLDLWGDRTVCTRMAVLHHPARAVLMRTHDEKDLGRRHWSLDVDGIADVRFHLIEHPRVGLWTLVADGGERGTAVWPLLPTAWFTAAKPG